MWVSVRRLIMPCALAKRVGMLPDHQVPALVKARLATFGGCVYHDTGRPA